ncbi:diaminohydroxyphosphoribosylaminopyrimidine deaminase / 5-amino-6-(5-phosphoribosylamino)uracil reductase [Apostasia shenzhenica]|uniref:Riboflavin biosynthesis protein PYRD, chloroplastic n=1 Tax=Apostasia shenzhenica TaxID=1088818 RepID=A0A2I0B0G0_9ASPA|nr:diaminohydroxyphosphoribosylaminopyrimidine deaminase / 5-amino-6-(5-phosphoribosylamino)uracil reductase [Apostasia shenzhenica]
MAQVLHFSFSSSSRSQIRQSSLSSRFLSSGTDHIITSVSIIEAGRNESFRGSRKWRHQMLAALEKEDGFYMRRCVELAKRAVGCTSPNPMVGCVIVKEGEIVGEGFHPKAGQPHAEVFALTHAGSMAENATAYVSLEPCNHYGRTPPCTEALINAKVKKVIIGMVDPNPIVASKGVRRLQEAGIDVVVGVEEMFCKKLNEAYIHRMHTLKPFVTLRYTLSMDGRMLTYLGKGADESGGYYSKMLQEYDGIMISGELLSRNFTLPLSFEDGANQPLHIIIARNINKLHLPASSIESASHVLVIAENDICVEPKSERVAAVVLESMNLKSILDYLGSRGLCSVLLDFRENHGAIVELIKDGFRDGLFQKVVMELCSVFGGDNDASLPSFGEMMKNLKDFQSRSYNESLVVEGYFS